MRFTRILAIITLAIVTISSIACSSNSSLSPEEAQAIAEKAYIFAYPMLQNYKTMYTQIFDPNNTNPLSPKAFNTLANAPVLMGPDDRVVVRPNNDSFYSIAWLDLRREPVVITVPEIADRYYSFQLVDLYTYNIGYIGTRVTGTAAGNYLIAGPSWDGSVPLGMNGVYRSEGNFVYSLTRTGYLVTDTVINNVDINVRAIQQQYKVQPLSKFLGQTVPDPPPTAFPPFDEAAAETVEFISYFNFLLGQLVIGGYEPDTYEQALIAGFDKIGIGPNWPFDSSTLNSETFNAINAGVKAALDNIKSKAVSLVNTTDGWQLSGRIFGNREAMEQTYPDRDELYLVRAAAAHLGLYGNDLEEACYPTALICADADGGGTLDASGGRNYILKFAPGNFPTTKTNGFWSLTMYGSDELLVANSINRYSIGDRTQGIVFGGDGSLTIYIQKDRTGVPGSAEYENWLPAPDGQFQLTLRIYLPDNVTYAPPGVRIR